MLRFTVTDRDGSERELGRVLTVVLDCDVRVPADSLTLTCPYDGALRQSADRIRAYRDGALVFEGQLDNISAVKRSDGAILRLSARSPAAGLLDNEAEPVTYYNPSDSLMERRHLAPFGIRLEKCGSTPYYDALKIDKGTSHWQVLRNFCRNRYRCEPRVTGDGRGVLDGSREAGEVLFSDRGEGVVYYALQESQKRHALLSEVRLKFRQADTYASSIKNPNPAAAAVKRVRYVNAAADKTTVATAEQMIETGNRNSYSLVLGCSGCHVDVLGKDAVVEDSVLGRLTGLTAEKIRYSVNRHGEQTEITLKRSGFDVADALHHQ